MRLLLRKPSKNPVDVHIIVVPWNFVDLSSESERWEAQERLSETEGDQCKDAAQVRGNSSILPAGCLASGQCVRSSQRKEGLGWGGRKVRFFNGEGKREGTRIPG